MQRHKYGSINKATWSIADAIVALPQTISTFPHFHISTFIPMREDAVRILFVAIALLAAAAVQETLPAFGGVKAPLLLAFSMAAACASFLEAPVRIGAAVAGGFLSGSLSALPFACAEFYFLASSWAAAAMWRRRENNGGEWLFGLVSVAVAAGTMQIWLYLWGTPGTDGSMLTRALPAVAAGAPIGAAFFALIDWTGERLGLK